MIPDTHPRSYYRRQDGAAFSTAYLNRLYPLPRPFLSIEDWQRWWHRDLAGLDLDALWVELRRLRRRLDYEHDRLHRRWLQEREAAILRAIGARKSGARHGR